MLQGRLFLTFSEQSLWEIAVNRKPVLPGRSEHNRTQLTVHYLSGFDQFVDGYHS